jgi:hypothetical protein
MSEATITRSTGIRVPGWSGPLPGGGYRGITSELDAVVAEAAAALASAYGQPVVIRFNSDRESGGAWLVTGDGRDNETGIGASLVTARARASWLRSAERYEHEAETGQVSWQAAPLTEDQREGTRMCAMYDRECLAACPEGQLTVYAHITQSAALPELRAQLAALDGWNDMSGRPSAYHHGAAPHVAAALARCLRFVPSTADLADLVRLGRDAG